MQEELPQGGGSGETVGAVSGRVAKLPLDRVYQEIFSLRDLMEQYWHVSRCWADHSLAVKDGMTFEVAINTLRRVRDIAPHHKGGERLSRMAQMLMTDIVENTADLEEVNATFCMECSRHTDSAMFDGCMVEECPHGHKPR